MKYNKFPSFLLFTVILVWVITAINPVYPHDWLMENILFSVFFAILIFTYKKFTFSNISYFLITLFFILHLVGAHYTYSEVPLGFWAAQKFDLSRNHFDRLVHFSFGLLIAYPFREILIRIGDVKGFFKYSLPVTMTLSWSAFFELIEWLFVSLVNPQLGVAYLGTQGDVWDAHQDMLLALIGSIITMIITFIAERNRTISPNKI
jgi:putative membrane protein